MEEKIYEEFVVKPWDRDYEKEREAEKEEYLRGAVKAIRQILKEVRSSRTYIKEIDEILEELKDEVGEI